jgi:hypothetical protein
VVSHLSRSVPLSHLHAALLHTHAVDQQPAIVPSRANGICVVGLPPLARTKAQQLNAMTSKRPGVSSQTPLCFLCNVVPLLTNACVAFALEHMCRRDATECLLGARPTIETHAAACDSPPLAMALCVPSLNASRRQCPHRRRTHEHAHHTQMDTPDLYHMAAPPCCPSPRVSSCRSC